MVSLALFDYLHGKYENVGIVWIYAHPDVSTLNDGYPQRSRHGTWQPFGRKSSWSSAANNANVRRQTPTCARRSWATQTRFLDSSMEMNPSISLIAYSEEDARYRSYWVKSPFMKGITALRSATLKALRLCSIFSASCLNCSLSKMPSNAGFSTNQKKQERQRLGSCSTEPALPAEVLLQKFDKRIIRHPPNSRGYIPLQKAHGTGGEMVGDGIKALSGPTRRQGGRREGGRNG